MTENTKKLSSDKKYILNSIIGIVLMFGIGFLPPVAPITSLGMKFLGILVGLIYLWSFVEMLWPSILGLVAIALTNQVTGSTLTASAFGGDMIWLCLFSMAIVFSLTNTGIFDYVTNWLLTRPIFLGHPWRLSIFIIFGFYFISVLGGGIAIMFILWELIYSIVERAGMKRTDPYCSMMIVGLIIAFVGGGATLPFKPNYLFVVGTFQKMTGMPDIPMVTATFFNMTVFLTELTIYMLLVRFFARIDVSPLKSVDVKQFVKELPPMNKTQKFAGAYLIFFVIMLMLPGTIGLFSADAISKTLQNIGTIGMCYALFALLAIIRIDGKPILVFSKVAHQIQWDAIFLMGIAFTLSPMLTAESTGISAFVGSKLGPILAGNSPYMFVVLMFTILLLMTNLANNTVCMILVMTVMVSFLPTMDLNLPMIALLMTPMAQTAFLLPASSFYGALIHSQAQQVLAKNLYIFAIFSMIAAFLMMILVGIPLGNIVF